MEPTPQTPQVAEKTNQNYTVKLAFRSVTASAILALGIFLAAALGSYAFYGVHTLDNTLSVTGSATQKATADSARWTVSVSRTAVESEVGSAQTKVDADAKQVSDFFTAAGVSADKITVSTTYVDQVYSSDTRSVRSYSIHKDVTMESSDVKLVDTLSKNIGSLLTKGVLVSAQAPQYYISTLPELRVALIGKAIVDAKARATEIAKANGQSVGALQSASGGVVQVMASNSVDVSDYGSYDSSTIEKQVMVTTHATFYLR
jgi:hypothetical protein